MKYCSVVFVTVLALIWVLWFAELLIVFVPNLLTLLLCFFVCRFPAIDLPVYKT